MSNRGGYGFVLNGQEKIIYVGKGAEFGGLGDTALGWSRKVMAGPTNAQEIVMKQIQTLQEAEGTSIVPEPLLVDILKIGMAIRPVSITKEYDWYSVMREVAYNPQNVLDIGYYLDAAWLIDSADCEYLYLIDFDKGMFEVYYDTHMARNLPASGRFNERTDNYETTTREESTYINMIASYPLESLPESVGHLQDDIYEPEFWATFC